MKKLFSAFILAAAFAAPAFADGTYFDAAKYSTDTNRAHMGLNGTMDFYTSGTDKNPRTSIGSTIGVRTDQIVTTTSVVKKWELNLGSQTINGLARFNNDIVLKDGTTLAYIINNIAASTNALNQLIQNISTGGVGGTLAELVNDTTSLKLTASNTNYIELSGSTQTKQGGLILVGDVTAKKYHGDGSALTGISGGGSVDFTTTNARLDNLDGSTLTITNLIKATAAATTQGLAALATSTAAQLALLNATAAANSTTFGAISVGTTTLKARDDALDTSTANITAALGSTAATVTTNFNSLNSTYTALTSTGVQLTNLVAAVAASTSALNSAINSASGSTIKFSSANGTFVAVASVTSGGGLEKFSVVSGSGVITVDTGPILNLINSTAIALTNLNAAVVTATGSLATRIGTEVLQSSRISAGTLSITTASAQLMTIFGSATINNLTSTGTIIVTSTLTVQGSTVCIGANCFVFPSSAPTAGQELGVLSVANGLVNLFYGKFGIGVETDPAFTAFLTTGQAQISAGAGFNLAQSTINSSINNLNTATGTIGTRIGTEIFQSSRIAGNATFNISSETVQVSVISGSATVNNLTSTGTIIVSSTLTVQGATVCIGGNCYVFQSSAPTAGQSLGVNSVGNGLVNILYGKFAAGTGISVETDPAFTAFLTTGQAGISAASGFNIAQSTINSRLNNLDTATGTIGTRIGTEIYQSTRISKGTLSISTGMADVLSITSVTVADFTSSGSAKVAGDFVAISTDNNTGWLCQVAVSSIVVSTPGTFGYAMPQVAFNDSTPTASVWEFHIDSRTVAEDFSIQLFSESTGTQPTDEFERVAIGSASTGGSSITGIIWQSTTAITLSSTTPGFAGPQKQSGVVVITGSNVFGGTTNHVIYVKRWREKGTAADSTFIHKAPSLYTKKNSK